jgi:hypothetical protein
VTKKLFIDNKVIRDTRSSIASNDMSFRKENAKEANKNGKNMYNKKLSI